VLISLAGLFAASFLAATILPFYSEVILFALLKSGASPPWLLVTVASVGNTLGAVVNWWLGRYLLHFQDRKWFPFKPADVARVQHWFQRYGVWSLAFAWMPVGGDALTFVAGTMRVRLPIFLLLVGGGKLLRYIAVVYLADWIPVAQA
jgi:membrane protein YqaA with SNARE-associated domain